MIDVQKASIENDKVRLDELKNFGEQTRRTYDKLEIKVDNKYTEVVQKIREDYKEVKRQLEENRMEDFKHIEKQRNKVEQDIETNQEKMNGNEVAMDTAQGMDSSQIRQTSVLNSSDTYAIDKYNNIEYSSSFNDAASMDNLIGSIVRVKKSGEGNSKLNCNSNTILGFINQPLTHMTYLTASFDREIGTGYSCFRFEKLGETFVFANASKPEIMEYTLEGNRSRDTIRFPQIGRIQCIRKLPSGLALATKNGLYIADLDGYLSGNIKSTIMKDINVSDISILGDTLYVLDNWGIKVRVLKQSKDGETYLKHNEFPIANYVQHALNSIQVTTDHIYVALIESSIIYQYCHKGVLQATITSHNKALGKKPEIDKLTNPIICRASTEGSLLVLQGYPALHPVTILTDQGQWFRLPISGISHPFDAWVEDNNVWVYDGDTKSCKQFVMHDFGS